MSEYRIEIPAAERLGGDDCRCVCFHIPYAYQDAVAGLRQRAADRGIGHYRLTIDLPSRRKSTGPKSQNNHFHGHCRQIALWHGNSITAIKDWVKREAVDRMGYPVEILPDQSSIAKGVTDATSEEISILIECCHLLAAEEGIVLREEDSDADG